MLQLCLYNQNCKIVLSQFAKLTSCVTSMTWLQWHLVWLQWHDFNDFNDTLCNFNDFNDFNDILYDSMIFRALFSLYLNRLLDGFFGFYLILCRKVRATIWANFCAIWSTGSKVIALFLIHCLAYISTIFWTVFSISIPFCTEKSGLKSELAISQFVSDFMFFLLFKFKLHCHYF